MTERDVKKAMRYHYIAFSVLLLLIVFFAGVVFWLNHLPIDPTLETDSLEKATSGVYLALCEGVCYELDTPNDLAAACGFDQWILLKDAPETVSRILTLRLGETYELALYEDGYAEAFNGYSERYHKSTAWYSVPVNAATSLSEYIRENGTVIQPLLGPGSWFIINES